MHNLEAKALHEDTTGLVTALCAMRSRKSSRKAHKNFRQTFDQQHSSQPSLPERPLRGVYQEVMTAIFGIYIYIYIYMYIYIYKYIYIYIYHANA